MTTIFQVDAFADRPFAGNPAGVCITTDPREEQWMQSVAQEMNLSETAFLFPIAEGYRLRWFTPTVEVALCGHATLASAHILWEQNFLATGSMARFQTLSGELRATHRGEGIEMDFPAKPVTPAPAPSGLWEALSVEGCCVGRNDFDYLIEVDREETLLALKPNFGALAQIPVRGIIVTCRSTEPAYDFKSRFFAPASGVNEDPVTGSAHCALGPFWRDQLGRDELTGYQASARGGVVRVRVVGDRVFLGGRAITVLRGELL